MAEINLMDLPLQDVKKIYDQFKDEIDQLSSYMRTLSNALERFSASNSCLEQLKSQEAGRTVLAPLTQSLYVPAEISDVNNVLVDIGTGYFVRRNISQAQGIMQRKIKVLKDTVEKLQETVTHKTRQLETVQEVLQHKVALIQRQQAQSAQQAK
jgi:prefoldin alpha subunit